MLLLVGLGNPGKKYDLTRHNVGFMVVDVIARDFCYPKFVQKHNALIAVGDIAGHRVILMKPCTYMNQSGVAVLSAASTYKIAPDSITVFHDDVALLSGVVKVKIGGSSAGHNGIRSIDSHIGTGYRRVRIGLGPKPTEDLSHFVLSNFENLEVIKELVDNISANLPTLLNGNTEQFIAEVSNPQKCNISSDAGTK